MRIALEIPAVLEGARLAFVDVDCHHARRRLGGHQAPFTPGGEARAAEAAQARVLHDLGQRLALVLAGEAVADQLVAAVLAIFLVADIRRDRAIVLLLVDGGAHLVSRGVADRVLADVHARRDLAAADARRRDDPHARSEIHF